MSTAAPPCQAEVLDRARLERALGDDPAALREVYGLFLDDARRLAHRLISALAARDFAQARTLGHTLKGSAANIGAEALRALGLRIQQASEAQDEVVLTNLALRLPGHLHRFEATIEA